MAKSDFICESCKEVKELRFFQLGLHTKYTCPKCGTLCKNCVKVPFFGTIKCKKCGSKVLKYDWRNDKWVKC